MQLFTFTIVLACSIIGSKCAKTPQTGQTAATHNYSPEIEAVFGKQPAASNAPSTSNNHKQGDSNPATGEITDPDYWDDDSRFKPSSLEYDQFDWNLMKRIAETEEHDNILISPFNLKTALAILGEAGTGATRQEILDVLNYPAKREDARNKFSKLLKSLSTPSSDYTVELGSRLYLDKNVVPRQKFMSIAQSLYQTDIKNLDFNNPVQSAAEVNAWVASATKGHIENLVSEDDIDDAVMLILTTIYFKGNWRHQFPLNQTEPKNFYLNSSRQVSIPMMYQTGKFYYYESSDLDAKILRLPYLGGKFAMYVILPHAVNGLNALVKDIYAFNIRKDLFNLREETVRVSIPLFKFDFLSQLSKILKDMGIREAFEDTASLPGIARGQTLTSRLKVTNVIQKAGIEINEVGSTAYAATEISLVNKFGSDDDEEVDFVADKPFMFYIEDESTRQILFIGTVRDPRQMKGIIDEVPDPEPGHAGKLPLKVPAGQAKPNASGKKGLQTANRFGQDEYENLPDLPATPPLTSSTGFRPQQGTEPQRSTGLWYYFTTHWLQ